MIETVFKGVALLLTLISSYLTASWLAGIPAGLADSIVMGFVGVLFTICMVTFPGIGLRVGGPIGFGMLLCGVCMLGLSVFASYERLDSGYFAGVQHTADQDSKVMHLEDRLAQLNSEIQLAMNTAELDAESGYRARSLTTQQTVLPDLRAQAQELMLSIGRARDGAVVSGSIPESIRAFVYLTVSLLIDVCAQLVILFLLFKRSVVTSGSAQSASIEEHAEIGSLGKNEDVSHPGVIVNDSVNEKYVFRNRVSQNRLEKDFGRDTAKEIIKRLIDINRVNEDKTIIKAA